MQVLANRLGATPVVRQPVAPAPQLVRPAPAQMKGPQVIREEKPDHVPAQADPRSPGELEAEPGSLCQRLRRCGRQTGRLEDYQ